MKENELIAARVAGPRGRDRRHDHATPSAASAICPATCFTPAILAEKAQELAQGRALTVKVWNERHLKRDGFGGILAVGRGSVASAAPDRHRISRRREKRETPIALVGKAVTFDTGGISIKPGAAMDEMKWDKMGGLAVLGMMLAAADLKLPLNLVGLIPSAENMPGPDAYRPGDIITTRDGKTIEVLNTDAEGRIILVDAIAHARLTYKPSAILEYSTLTGAVIMALGHHRAGLFTSEEKLRDAFIAAGKTHRRTRLGPCRSTTSTAKTSSPKSPRRRTPASAKAAPAPAPASSSCGPRKSPFVHLDIAGTAWTTKPPAHLEGGATGLRPAPDARGPARGPARVTLT